MKHIVFPLYLALLLTACSPGPQTPAAPNVSVNVTRNAALSAHVGTTAASIDWVKPEGASLEAIFAAAQTDHKPVFLYWGAVWCPPCNQIKATVFKRADFVARSKLFVPVYLDGDTAGAQKLATRYKVRGYPTMILFKPDGSEITRLPAEVDAAQYMQVLALGLNATHSVKDSVAAALSAGHADAPPLSGDAWRMLAYYSWETDESQLLAKNELVATLQKLAQACPSEYREASARLTLKALALAAPEKSVSVDRVAALAKVQQLLQDPALMRDNVDTLANAGADIVAKLTQTGTPERQSLEVAWNAALDQLASDATLSVVDRLSAVQGKVALARIDAAKDSRPAVTPILVAQARAAAVQAGQSSVDKYERQAVIPAAADLLSDVGLLDESDALLKTELPVAVSPYYHMLVLSANARMRGDTVASLDWAQQAYHDASGPATRLQWGSGYVSRLIELAPQDEARIAQAAAAVIAELQPVPETFYERNRRSLEKMGGKLQDWGNNARRKAVVRKLSAQLTTVCHKLPVADPSRGVCLDAFRVHGTSGKA